MAHTVRNNQLIEDLKREFMTRTLARQSARTLKNARKPLFFRLAETLRVPAARYTYGAPALGR